MGVDYLYNNIQMDYVSIRLIITNENNNLCSLILPRYIN